MKREASAVTPSGRFRVSAAGLEPGLNRFTLEGRKPGREPWRLEVRINRVAAGPRGA